MLCRLTFQNADATTVPADNRCSTEVFAPCQPLFSASSTQPSTSSAMTIGSSSG